MYEYAICCFLDFLHGWEINFLPAQFLWQSSWFLLVSVLAFVLITIQPLLLWQAYEGREFTHFYVQHHGNSKVFLIPFSIQRMCDLPFSTRDFFWSNHCYCWNIWVIFQSCVVQMSSVPPFPFLYTIVC